MVSSLVASPCGFWPKMARVSKQTHGVLINHKAHLVNPREMRIYIKQFICHVFFETIANSNGGFAGASSASGFSSLGMGIKWDEFIIALGISSTWYMFRHGDRFPTSSYRFPYTYSTPRVLQPCRWTATTDVTLHCWDQGSLPPWPCLEWDCESVWTLMLI